MKNIRYRVTYIDPADTSDEYHFYSDNKQRALEHAQQFVGRRGEVTVSVLKEHHILQSAELHDTHSNSLQSIIY